MNRPYFVFISLFTVESDHEPTLLRLFIPLLLLSPTMNRPYSVFYLCLILISTMNQPTLIYHISLLTVKSDHEPTLLHYKSLLEAAGVKNISEVCKRSFFISPPPLTSLNYLNKLLRRLILLNWPRKYLKVIINLPRIRDLHYWALTRNN